LPNFNANEKPWQVPLHHCKLQHPGSPGAGHVVFCIRETDPFNGLKIASWWNYYDMIYPDQYGYPKMDWFIMENHIKIDDLGVPLLSETSIFSLAIFQRVSPLHYHPTFSGKAAPYRVPRSPQAVFFRRKQRGRTRSRQGVTSGSGFLSISVRVQE